MTLDLAHFLFYISEPKAAHKGGRGKGGSGEGRTGVRGGGGISEEGGWGRKEETGG